MTLPRRSAPYENIIPEDNQMTINRIESLRRHGRFMALAALLIACQLTPSLSWGQGLRYVDADNDEFFLGTDNLSPNSAFGASAGGATAIDQLWNLRNNVGSDGTVYETRTNEVVPEITMTVGAAHGLSANTNYDIYIVHWSPTGEDWTIAGGLLPGQKNIFNRAGPNGTFPTATASLRAGAAYWQSPPPPTVAASNPTFTEGNRVMLMGKIGSATSDGSGNLNVYINDPGGSTDTSRTWFDGIAYVEAGTPVSLTAAINRATGNLTIANPTAGSFQVKSISVTSGAGALNATLWSSISSTADGDSGGSFDSDVWNVTQPLDPATTPFATQLAEAEAAGAATVGGTLASGGSINLGNVWQRTIFEDVVVNLTLADNTAFTIVPEYSGAEIVAGDFNADGVIDIANDYATMMSNLLKPFPTGTTGAAAYKGGDFTGNGIVNFNDFAAFREAYDALNGAGSFAAAVQGVPEPAGLFIVGTALAGLGALVGRRRTTIRPEVDDVIQSPSAPLASTAKRERRRRFHRSCLASMALVFGSAIAHGAPVTGWQIDPILEPTDPAPVAGAATASPTLGDGSPQSAANSAIWAAFPTVTLAHGEQITLTGSVTLVGITPAANNLRFGLFKDDGVAPATGGWRGYIAETSNAGAGGTMLVRNPAGTDFANQPFMSTTGGRSAALAAAANSGADLVDGTYQFTMTASRFGNEMELRGSFVGGTGFKDVYRSATDADAARIPTGFQFDRAGVLSGGGLNADQLAFSNIDVTKSATTALTLKVTTSGGNAGKMEIVNTSGTPFNMAYYQIASPLGALSLSGWNSLDDQEGNDPVGMGWQEAGGSSGLIIAEGNLTGAKSFALPTDSVQLGNAYDTAGAQDLRFHYGLPDGTLLRGFVEYVQGTGGLPGDFNGDTVVNGADLEKWKGDFGVGAGSDANNDGVTDGADFLIWQRNFQASATSPAAAAIPEPGVAALSLVAAVPFACRRLRS
jgi:hypothetical protein